MSISNNYSITYQNDLLHSYMVIKLAKEDSLIEYQMKMIKENPVPQLLALHKTQLDHESFLFYDITSKVTLEQLLARKKLNKHEFLSIVKSLIKGLQLGRQYILKGGSYMLRSDRVYINPSGLELSLAYLPIEVETDINEEVKLFVLDLIVYKVSFTDRDEGNFVYQLLNLLRSDNFRLKSLEELVNDMALEKIPEQMDCNNRDNNTVSNKTKKSLSPKGVAVATEMKAPSMISNSLIISVLIQLFFTALGTLLLRYLYAVQGGIQYQTIAGIVLILAAIDFLTVKKLQPREMKKMNAARTIGKKPRGEKQLKKQKTSNSKHGTSSYNSERRNDSNLTIETSILKHETVGMAHLICCNENSNEKILLNKPSFVIGRIKAQVDYAPQNNAVGKLHAEIVHQEGNYFIKDLNSRNGTYINGVKIHSNTLHSVKHNDIIAFANSEFRFLTN